MRRIAGFAALIAAAAGFALDGGAGADDTHNYRIEMHNAFGILEGSEVRVAGVGAGAVTDLDITEAKRAVVTVEVSGPLSVFGDRTTCSTKPQSLIAEYFIDCDPKGESLADGATIPAGRVAQTVQLDLVTNTLRLPFRERLRLVVNEFGTALAGNADNLSEAIRLSVPALGDLREVTAILARQRHEIDALNANADRLLARLAERRDAVVGTIVEARDVAATAAGRGSDLSRDVDLLDDFVHELRPTLAELGEVAREGTPLLASLRQSASGLNELATILPGFNRAAEGALVSLGEAAGPGREALERGRDEVEALNRAGRNAAATTEILADLLVDLDDPRRHVEVDQRAARTCEDPSKPCYATGREAPTGYTALEGLLNYTYYQSLALNQFDSVGHILQFNVFEPGTQPCGDFNARPNVPAAGGGRTSDILQADPCVAWLGPNQPDVSFDLGLPRYDNSVCPDGSTDPELCDPQISTNLAPSEPGPGPIATPGQAPGGTGPDRAGEEGTGVLPPEGGDPVPDGLEGILGLPPVGPLDEVRGRAGRLEGGVAKLGAGGERRGERRASRQLLRFLYGS